jgi:hypothetical protein
MNKGETMLHCDILSTSSLRTVRIWEMSPECGDTANVKTIFRRWGDSQEIEMRQYISFSSSDGKMITGKRIDLIGKQTFTPAFLRNLADDIERASFYVVSARLLDRSIVR